MLIVPPVSSTSLPLMKGLRLDPVDMGLKDCGSSFLSRLRKCILYTRKAITRTEGKPRPTDSPMMRARLLLDWLDWPEFSGALKEGEGRRGGVTPSGCGISAGGTGGGKGGKGAAKCSAD